MSNTLSGKPVDCSYTHFYKVVCNGTTNIDMLVIHIFGRRMSIVAAAKMGMAKYMMKENISCRNAMKRTRFKHG